MIVELDLCGRNVLVVGGGKVAYRKCRKLLAEGGHVHAVAKTFLPCFDEMDIHKEKRGFSEELLQGFFLIVAATDSIFVNQSIVSWCSERNVLCNCASHGKGTVSFAAEYKGRDIKVGVFTDGRSPARAKTVRDSIEWHIVGTRETERLNR